MLPSHGLLRDEPFVTFTSTTTHTHGLVLALLTTLNAPLIMYISPFLLSYVLKIEFCICIVLLLERVNDAMKYVGYCSANHKYGVCTLDDPRTITYGALDRSGTTDRRVSLAADF